MQEILSYIEEREEEHLYQLAELIAIPSVSTLSDGDSMMRCAVWLRDHMDSIGLESSIWMTDGHPGVFGEWTGAEGAPTLLVYGHYDVQPADPVDLWESPPFLLTRKDDKLTARGISDDKGQVFLYLKAVEAFFATGGTLPINIKILIEGEEEIGSPSLPALLRKQAERLKADVASVSDNPMLGRGLPAVGYGLRGLAYMTITVSGPGSDLHSGRFGGAVENPAHVLCRLLAGLKEPGGRIAVEGFYDDVLPLKDAERMEIAALPTGDAAVAQAASVEKLAPEDGYSAIESIWGRPSLDINGLTSGFQGEGAKTIIPSSASAKISCRLVPNQDPNRIMDRIEEHLLRMCPDTVRIEVERFEGAHPAMTDRDDPMLERARLAVEKGFAMPCRLIRQGGTIPVISMIREILGLNTLLLGFGLPDENAHAPNEFFLLDNYRGGLRSICYLFDLLRR